MDLLWSTACTFPPFAISKFRRVRLRSIRPFSFARSQPFSVHRLWCSLLWAVVNPHFAWKCRTCFCASISGSFEGSHIPSFPGPSLLRFRHVGSWRKSNYILSYHLPFVFGTRASPLLKITISGLTGIGKFRIVPERFGKSRKRQFPARISAFRGKMDSRQARGRKSRQEARISTPGRRSLDECPTC